MKVRVAGCIVSNHKLLLLKYIYNGTTVYNIPGGNVEFGESIEDCIIREMQEELNLKTSFGKQLTVAEVRNQKDNEVTLHIIHEIQIIENEPNINSSHTTALGFEWVEISKLSQINLYPNIANLLTSQLLHFDQNKIYLGEIEQIWW